MYVGAGASDLRPYRADAPGRGSPWSHALLWCHIARIAGSFAVVGIATLYVRAIQSAMCFATLRHQFSYEVTPAESGHAATHFEHAYRQVSTCKGHTYAQSSLRSMERYYVPNIKSRHELDRSYPHPLIRST